MKKRLKGWYAGLGFWLALGLFPMAAQAISPAASAIEGSLQGAGSAAYGTSTVANNAPQLIANGINVILGASGIVLIGYLVYAGILYMQAGSDPKKATQAKTIIVNAVIGLVIIVAAWAIANFVFQQLAAATGG